MARLSPYQRQLLFFLSVATLFEGYDFMALSQLLPHIRAELGLSIRGGGRLLAFVNIGTILAYFLIRHADRWGRRRVLLFTIGGYTLSTAASGLAVSVWDFALYQCLARFFLIAEYAITMVVAAEEFPPERRGAVIGLLQALTSIGAVACGALVPLIIQNPYGWRLAYFIALPPLLAMAFLRRGLRESQRFEALAQGGQQAPADLWLIFRTPYRRRVWQLALIWGLCYACSNNAIFFWKEFVTSERGFSNAEEARAITFAAAGSLPLLFVVGRMLDRLGRRKAALLILPLLSGSVAGIYQLHSFWPLTLALLCAVFSVTAALPLLNSLTTELFPTHLRGTGYAWSNNLLGRVSYVISPLIIGACAERVGYGATLTATTVLPLLALVLLLVVVPETKGLPLEETAAPPH